ncbi:hypothetical protein LV779_16975 [Streptomyces thinghirensis]|nr:hypothetical protein [Streptomyces thinghirensis]
MLTFEPNKGYLRELLDTQMDLTTLGAGYVREAHERFEKMQEQIHGGEAPPSDRDDRARRDVRPRVPRPVRGRAPRPHAAREVGRPGCPS